MLAVSQIARWNVVAGLADSYSRCNFIFLNYILTYTSYLTPPHKQMHNNIICLANDVAAEIFWQGLDACAGNSEGLLRPEGEKGLN